MKKLSLILLILHITLAVSFGQVDRSKQPAPGPAPEIQIGEYESFQLDNGLKVFLIENDKLPRVTYRLIFDRDPILEGDQAGYISFATELLKTGTKTRTKAEIDEEVDFIGASLFTSGGSINGSSLTKHTETLLEIMSDIIKNAEFKQEEFDKIKTKTLSNLALEKDDPNAIAGNVRSKLVYGGDHPYGENITEETVEAITLGKCREFYDTYYSPSIGYLAVVGNIDMDRAKELVTKYLGDWKAKEVPEFKYKTPRAPLIRKVAIVDRDNSVQSNVNVTYPVKLKIGSDDAIKASVLNTLLGGSFSSRLNQNLRELHAFTYGAHSSLSSDELIGSFTAGTEVRNSVTDSTVHEILEEMKRLRNEKVSEDELQRVKNYITGRFARSLENPQTVASFALNIARFDLPKNYYKNYLKKLNAVTVDDIQSTAKKYIKPNNAYVLVVGKASEIADKLKRFSVSGKIDYYDIYGNEYDPSMKAIPDGVTAESVIQHYIEAVGGKENMEKVKDKTSVMKGEMQGMTISLELYQKAPNMLYQKMSMGAMQNETKFDGTKGKVTAMGREVPLEGAQLETTKLQATLNYHLHIGDLGLKPELAGMEDFEGKDVYKINYVTTTGETQTYYYDVESGLLVKQFVEIKTPQGTMNTTIVYDDYQPVNGVKYPFTLTQSMGPGSITLTVEKIEVNTGLEDSLFEIE